MGGQLVHGWGEQIRSAPESCAHWDQSTMTQESSNDPDSLLMPYTLQGQGGRIGHRGMAFGISEEKPGGSSPDDNGQGAGVPNGKHRTSVKGLGTAQG